MANLEGALRDSATKKRNKVRPSVSATPLSFPPGLRMGLRMKAMRVKRETNCLSRRFQRRERNCRGLLPPGIGGSALGEEKKTGIVTRGGNQLLAVLGAGRNIC